MMTRNRSQQTSWSDVGQRVAAELANETGNETGGPGEDLDGVHGQVDDQQVQDADREAGADAASHEVVIDGIDGNARVDPGQAPTSPNVDRPTPTGVSSCTTEKRARAALWVLGAHGGAGTTTVASLGVHWADGGRSWPFDVTLEQQDRRRDSGPDGYPTVLVARTHAPGLLAARTALSRHVSSETATARLVGLILVADAPGKLPKPLRDLVAHVSGAAPQVWHLGWVPELRFGPPDPTARLPKPLQRLASDLDAALNPTPTSHNLGRNQS